MDKECPDMDSETSGMRLLVAVKEVLQLWHKAGRLKGRKVEVS